MAQEAPRRKVRSGAARREICEQHHVPRNSTCAGRSKPIRRNEQESRHQPVGVHVNNKVRKLHTLIGICLGTAPCLALASPPSDAAAGQIDAILSFCTKAVPELERSALAYRAALNANGPRNSSAYRDGFEQVSEALQKGNHGQEVAACVAGLKEHKEHKRWDDHRPPVGAGNRPQNWR